MNLLFLQSLDPYPKADIDVEVSGVEDDVTKKSTGDDVEDGGASTAKPIAPILISSNVTEQANPSVTDQVASTDPPASEHKRKRRPPVPKLKQSSSSVDQVMTHIELPPYRRLQNPLDLVAREIIFERLFEAFRHMSQATGTGTSVGGDIQPKKICQPSLKRILVPR
jgi:hypothetical protein